MNKSMGLAGWAALLLTAAMFGSSFVLTKLAIESISPLTVAAGRVALAAPLAWAVLRLSGERLPPLGAAWIPLLILGFLTAAIPYTAIAWGQVNIASGLGGILFGTIPIFTVVLAQFLTADEKLTPERSIGSIVGLAGVVVVVGPGALMHFDDYVGASVITLLGALSYALGGIYARRNPQLSPLVMVTGQLLTATVMLVSLSLAVDTPWTLQPSPGALGAVAAVAVLSTVLPALLLFWLIRRVGATSGSVVAFFLPVVAVVLGAALLGERLPVQTFVGLGLILLGAFAINSRFPRLAKAN